MANQYRDRIISSLSEKDVGQELRVCGWIENIRDHGGVSFIDLRDMYGTLQVVMRDTSLLDGLVKEECISIQGKIEHRDEETYNPKIATGTIELEAHSVDVLGKVYTQLPFEIMTSKEIREDVRLKYRYLDLRNQKVKDNIIFRSNVIAFLRQKMTEMGFWRSRLLSLLPLHLRVQETTSFLPESGRASSMRFRRHLSSLSSS